MPTFREISTELIPNVPSRKAVRRTGEVLSVAGSSLWNFEAMEVLSAWRLAHAGPCSEVQKRLKGFVKRMGLKNAIVVQRLKRTPSIVEKLKRFEHMSLDRMQDIGGLRVIVEHIEDVYRLHGLITSSKRFTHQLELPPNDYIASPKPDGYRSLHQVIRYRNETHEELNGLRLEIQIRTRLQHAWATAVETLGMIQKSSLKTGGGDEATKRFFKVVSALFAMDEKCNLPEEFQGSTHRDLSDELKAIDGEQKFLSVLEGVAVSAHHIDTVTKSYTGYHVVELFIAEQRVRLTPFSVAQDAESFYKAKEMQTKDDSNIAVVLMSAGALKDIKKAYPNYFLDTRSFLQNIKRIAGL